MERRAGGGRSFGLCANVSMMFTEYGFMERFAAARQAGFGAVELLYPYGLDISEIRQQLDDNNLDLILVNSPVGEPTRNEKGLACLAGRQDEFRRSVDEALSYALPLGVRFVHLLTGVPDPDLPREAVEDILLENLSWAAGLARSAGLTLTLEALNSHDVPGYYISTQRQAADIVQRVNSPFVRLQFDFYHCRRSGENEIETFVTLRPLVAHVQVADTPRRSEPGSGELDFEAIFDCLKATDYSGWVGCEYRPAEKTVAGLAWIDRYGLRTLMRNP